MKKFFFLFVYVLLLTSCSSGYINSIPAESKAIISFNLDGLSKESDGNSNDKATAIKNLLHINDIDDCGIDLSSKIYMFVSPDGYLGLAAKVNDEGDMKDWFDKLSKSGKCIKIKEHRGSNFTVLNNSWVVGFNDNAMLIMGPSVGTAQAQLMQDESKYLKQDEDEGLKSSLMYDKLDSIDSNIAMVSQAAALPQKFVAPFVLGAPKGTDPSEVIIAASMNVKSEILNITGESFSFRPYINKALKAAIQTYRPIQGTFLNSFSSDSQIGIFMNVDGNKFINILRSDKGLEALLAGINSAIDMDNIIKSINGDFNIIVKGYHGDNPLIQMSAKLGNSKWLNDVGYWKQSCPIGGKILNWEKNSYYYTSKDDNFYFGVSPQQYFYAGSSANMAKQAISRTNKPIQPIILNQIKGKRFYMVLNLKSNSSSNNEINALTNILKPVFGNIKAITYSVK